MLLLPLLRVDMHLLQAFWNALRLPLGREASRKRRQVVYMQLHHHRIQCTMGGKKIGIIEDEMGWDGMDLFIRERAGFCVRIPKLS